MGYGCDLGWLVVDCWFDFVVVDLWLMDCLGGGTKGERGSLVEVVLGWEEERERGRKSVSARGNKKINNK